MTIEESEKTQIRTGKQGRTFYDKLVPYTLAGTGLTYLLTRNATKHWLYDGRFFMRTETG